MAKLEIIIKRQYFNEIKIGEKIEEYRLVNQYWAKRLVGKEYTHIIFKNGYNGDAPRFEIEYLGYELKNIKHEVFGDEDVCVFAIKLGKIKI